MFKKGGVPWNKGLKGAQEAWNKGKENSPETRKKISESLQGKPVWNKGIPRTPEEKIKISEGHLGIEAWNKGKKLTGKQKDATKQGALRRWKNATEEEIQIKKKQLHSGAKKYWNNEENRKKRALETSERWKNLSDDEKARRLEKWNGSANFESKLEDEFAVLLEEKGISFERQKRIGYYKVDFFLTDRNTVVEINGCYWHCCEQCGFDNRGGKRGRDKAKITQLKNKGYIVKIVWEHQLRTIK